MASRTIKLTIEYDGTDFHGWQVQPQLRTVQGVLEDALTGLFGVPTRPVGAGRTDAGVHALGQVASFVTEHPIPCHGLVRALNTRLGKDVAVRSAELEAEGFNARFSARGKWYQYRILRAPLRRPLLERTTHRVAWRLDLEAMQAAGRALEGTRDFRALAKACEDRPTVRTLTSVDVSEAGGIVFVDVRGDGFLYNMVRTIAGTLLDAGRGRLSPSEVPGMLAAKDRAAAGPTLPAKGLTMMQVYYSTPFAAPSLGTLA
ncbi:MAG: tRNA pseudouridine(38-40) synthase TruA [Planctomycetota bacterium]|jgi:tRNA pseudouridine38-40 synthase